MKGKYVRIKQECIADYETRGYRHNKAGYKVINEEPVGVYIAEYRYIILRSDLEVVDK